MTNLNEGARTCMVALAFERAKEGGHVTGFEPLAHDSERNEGSEELAKRGWLHDARGSARGGRLNLPTCAHLYIYIYIRLTSIPTLFFIPLSSGVLLLAAAAASGSGICGGDGGSGGGDVDGGGSSGDAGGCAFFRECSPSALRDDRHITLAPNMHPSNSYITPQKSFNFFTDVLSMKKSISFQNIFPYFFI